MQFNLGYTLLPCPHRVENVMRLNRGEMMAIQQQNQDVAEAQVKESADLMWRATISSTNEDAPSYFWKMRRDRLLEVLGKRDKYSWRKRDIAARELALMGYDVQEIM